MPITPALLAAAGVRLFGGLVSGAESSREIRHRQETVLFQNAFTQAVAEQNASFAREIAETNAGAAVSAARVEENRIRRQSRRAIGGHAARFGASGVSIDTGSPIESLAAKAAESEQNALIARHRGEVEARATRFNADVVGHRAHISALASGLTTDLRIDALEQANDNAVTRGFVSGVSGFTETLLSGMGGRRSGGGGSSVPSLPPPPPPIGRTSSTTRGGLLL